MEDMVTKSLPGSRIEGYNSRIDDIQRKSYSGLSVLSGRLGQTDNLLERLWHSRR